MTSKALNTSLTRPSSSNNTSCYSSTTDMTIKAVGGSKVIIYFSVSCSQIHDWEFVFVCGSHAKLGNWVVENAVEMQRQSRKSPSVWRTTIEIAAEECRTLVRFRYFIGYYLQSGLGAKKSLIVSKWESQHRARCILPSVETSNGICRGIHVDQFGLYGGKAVITNGWLNHVDQQTVLLRLRGEALKFYKTRHNERAYFLKVTPFDVRHREVGSNDDDGEDGGQGDSSIDLPLLPSFSSTEMANLLSDGESPFHEQPPYGKHFRNGQDFFVFKTHSLSVENLAFRIELFIDHDDSHASGANHSLAENFKNPNKNGHANDILERFAIVYCMPSSIPNTYGSVLLPIISKTQQPVGQLKVDYLFVNALSFPQNIETTFARHWKKRRIPVEVGHRGMGNSYTKFSTVRENTVDSMNHAAKNGADFVEFDVQLSKDKVPVIFHDFHVLVSVAQRVSNHLEPIGANLQENKNSPLSSIINKKTAAGGSSSQQPKILNTDGFHEIAVKDLLLRQLGLLHMHHCTAIDESHLENAQNFTLTDPNELPARRPFPTLVQALKEVDIDIGFNIEIKYPMKLVDGSTECANYYERNEYLDKILTSVLEFGGTRRIVFSSFEPDICAMIAMKQIKYPVLFLCIGHTVRYVPYDDERSASSRVAVNFANSFNLLGINFHSEDLLMDPSQVARARDNSLVSFVWGEDLEKLENIEYFRKKVLVDGIVYDGIGEHEPRQNIFVVEREAKHALFDGRRGQSPSPSRTSSFDTLKDAMLAGVSANVADASNTLKKAIRNIQRQHLQQDLATDTSSAQLVLPN